MHLFKAGSVGLGPYAFAPTGEGRWARLATGAPATRPGAYELNEGEAVQLAELADALEARPDPDAALTWAVGRFEMGCGRGSALEGLSDHLLALRAVLDGQGPVGASLPMRASALIACEEFDRFEARERIEQALELERSLMNGTQSLPGLALASWLEEGVRRIMREAALGELGSDLGAAAEETLIATGLQDGDGAIVGTTSEWEIPETGEVEETVTSHQELHREPQEEHDDQATRILEPIPVEGEIRITATPWLDEVEAPESTLDFPAVEGDVQHREKIDTPRVRHLFPVPEDADWEVKELKYDHYGREAG